MAMLKNSLLLPETERKSGNQLHTGRYHVQRVVGSSSGSSWQIMLHIYLYTCLVPLLNCQCGSSSGIVATRTLERILFLDLGLAVTEINIKKV